VDRWGPWGRNRDGARTRNPHSDTAISCTRAHQTNALPSPAPLRRGPTCYLPQHRPQPPSIDLRHLFPLLSVPVPPFRIHLRRVAPGQPARSSSNSGTDVIATKRNETLVSGFSQTTARFLCDSRWDYVFCIHGCCGGVGDSGHHFPDL